MFATVGDLQHVRLAALPDVVMQGRDGVADAIAVLERRAIEAAQSGPRTPGERYACVAGAHPADLAAWTAGNVDPQRTLALSRALMAVNASLSKLWGIPLATVPTSDQSELPDDAWMVLRLACLGSEPPGGKATSVNPATLRRLSSGDAATAVMLALRQLRIADVRCSVRASATSPETARLWAAALAFPISRFTAATFIRRLDPTLVQESRT